MQILTNPRDVLFKNLFAYSVSCRTLRAVMDRSFTCALLLLSFSAASGKYVYVEERKTWHEARSHCQMFYTDLAPVSSKHDIRRLKRLDYDSQDFVWIGMERLSTDREKWMWAGGGEVSRFFWAPNQPNNRPSENYGVIKDDLMHDSSANFKDPAFCYRVVVVRQRKTWEEALDYCRMHHRDLASVGSKAEMLLIQRELNKNVTTRRVWIGLHFFSGQWLWVDRQPLHYQAWAEDNKPACPQVKQVCAALQVTQRTDSNCVDSPLVNNASATGAVHTDGQRPVMNCGGGMNTFGGSAGVNHVWEAHDCQERLHFICY